MKAPSSPYDGLGLPEILEASVVPPAEAMRIKRGPSIQLAGAILYLSSDTSANNPFQATSEQDVQHERLDDGRPRSIGLASLLFLSFAGRAANTLIDRLERTVIANQP